MPNAEHLAILLKGVEAWNRWRSKRPDVHPDLRGFIARQYPAPVLGLDLRNANFADTNFRGADLYRCQLTEADFTRADLRGSVLGEVTAGGACFRHAMLRGAVMMKGVYALADFRHADFFSLAPDADTAVTREARQWWTQPAMLNAADLQNCDLRNARLESAHLDRVDLTDADLSGANLRDAKLDFVLLVRTRVQGTEFRGSTITGLCAFDLRGRPKDESRLVVRSSSRYPMVLDFLEAAQFVPLLQSERLGNALDLMAPKVVLILGRFSKQRKRVLEHLQAALTDRGWVALVSDFPAPKGITQTFKVLASLVGWVIADVTQATEIRTEITYISKEHRNVPIWPILQGRSREWFGLEELRRERSLVAKTLRYRDEAHLLQCLDHDIVEPARSLLGTLRPPQPDN